MNRCHDCRRTPENLGAEGGIYVRPPHPVALCERCADQRAVNLDAEAALRRREEERAWIVSDLARRAVEQRRLRARLRFLAPPTAREIEALRRLSGAEEETADDRRILRKRGWSRPMMTDTGDVLTPIGRAIARSVGIEPLTADSGTARGGKGPDCGACDAVTECLCR